MMNVALVSVLLLTTCRFVASHPHPNILMIMIDDLRPELGCYNHPHVKSPNIDKLADKSSVFYSTHAQFALCGPSRTSLLTGRRPDTLTVYDQHKPYWRNLHHQNYTSLPQYYKERGYHTVSLGKIYHPSKLSNKSDDYPYSWSELPYHPPTQRYRNDPTCPDADGSLHSNLICPVHVSSQPERSLPDIQTTQQAITMLDKLSQNTKPFFLAVGLHKPHVPFKYPQKYLNLYPLTDIKLATDNYCPKNVSSIAWNPFMNLKRREDMAKLHIKFPYGDFPQTVQKRIIQSYLACVSYIDDLVGDILRQVDNMSLWNNTIILLTSDHGWSLGEHGEWGKYSNYDIATRVPLMIYTPSHSKPNSTCLHKVYEMTELIDIFPTLVELSGHKPLISCQNKITTLCTEGESLVPAMHGVPSKEDGNVSFTQYPRPSISPQGNSDQPNRDDIRYMGYALKTSQYRYVVWVGFDISSSQTNMTDIVAEELYDIYTDPGEDNNLIYQLPHIRNKLYHQLYNFIHRYDKDPSLFIS